jgi:1-phosphatidylinositol-4-phosphate 5-kinase
MSTRECIGHAVASSCSPGGIHARNAKGERLLIYMGIIDILQNYRLLKKFEHAWKSVLYGGVSSCVVDQSVHHS